MKRIKTGAHSMFLIRNYIMANLATHILFYKLNSFADINYNYYMVMNYLKSNLISHIKFSRLRRGSRSSPVILQSQILMSMYQMRWNAKQKWGKNLIIWVRTQKNLLQIEKLLGFMNFSCRNTIHQYFTNFKQKDGE